LHASPVEIDVPHDLLPCWTDAVLPIDPGSEPCPPIHPIRVAFAR
jgi:hypothetical protein